MPSAFPPSSTSTPALSPPHPVVTFHTTPRPRHEITDDFEVSSAISEISSGDNDGEYSSSSDSDMDDDRPLADIFADLKDPDALPWRENAGDDTYSKQLQCDVLQRARKLGFDPDSGPVRLRCGNWSRHEPLELIIDPEAIEHPFRGYTSLPPWLESYGLDKLAAHFGVVVIRGGGRFWGEYGSNPVWSSSKPVLVPECAVAPFATFKPLRTNSTESEGIFLSKHERPKAGSLLFKPLAQAIDWEEVNRKVREEGSTAENSKRKFEAFCESLSGVKTAVKSVQKKGVRTCILTEIPEGIKVDTNNFALPRYGRPHSAEIEPTVPGVQTPYIYASLPSTSRTEEFELLPAPIQPRITSPAKFTPFALHREDLDLPSSNLCLSGGKEWLVVSPEDAWKLEAVLRQWHLPGKDMAGKEHEMSCVQRVRHKNVFLSPAWLDANHLRYATFRQNAGDLIVTSGPAYHQGLNDGPNLHIAINLWAPIQGMGCWCAGSNMGGVSYVFQ